MDDHFIAGSTQMGFDLGDSAPPQSYEPNRNEIRQELQEILEQARGANKAAPWDDRTFQYHKTVFPQMANWLPGDERDRMRAEFAQEVKRIEQLTLA